MPRGLRPRAATWMVAIALIALALGGERARQDAARRNQIARAAALLSDDARAPGRPADAPAYDPARLDVRLGGTTHRGMAREVVFTDPVGGATVTVTIPVTPPRPGVRGGPRIVDHRRRPVVPTAATWSWIR